MSSRLAVLVKKFGGTSVGNFERIQNVAKRVISESKHCRPVVVVSAMSGETNRLVAMANEMNSQYRGPAYDMLLATGEQTSVALMAMALEKFGAKAKPYLAHQLGIRTDNMYSRARIKTMNSEVLMKDIEQGFIPVVAGFQGVDDEDNFTTLGRGGSDTSAVALAAALGQKECEIFTDVPAVFTADPRIVPKAREIQKLSFEEMMEMASLGSKVLHIRSVEIGAKYGVKIHVRSTFETREGTWVVPEGDVMENPVVSSVTHEASVAVLNMKSIPKGTQVLSDLFGRLARKGIVVDIITQDPSAQDHQRLSFSVPADDAQGAQQIVRETFGNQCQLELKSDVSKISIVGVGMRSHPGVAARFFETLAKQKIDVHLVTTSEIKVSAIVNRSQMEIAAQTLHSEFGLDKE